jgi:hypothetical protein
MKKNMDEYSSEAGSHALAHFPLKFPSPHACGRSATSFCHCQLSPGNVELIRKNPRLLLLTWLLSISLRFHVALGLHHRQYNL